MIENNNSSCLMRCSFHQARKVITSRNRKVTAVVPQDRAAGRYLQRNRKRTEKETKSKEDTRMIIDIYLLQRNKQKLRRMQQAVVIYCNCVWLPGRMQNG